MTMNKEKLHQLPRKHFNTLKNHVFDGGRLHRRGEKLYIESRTELFGLEIIFNALTMFVITPFISTLLSLSLKASPLHYLTNNIIGIYHDPLFALASIFCAFLMAVWAFFEIIMIINAIDQIRRGDAVTLESLLPIAGRDLRRLLMPKNWPLLILSGLVLPFLNIFTTGTYLQSLPRPGYIMDVVWETPLYSVLFVVLLSSFAGLALRLMMVYHFFVLGDEDFKDAARHSSQMMRRSWFKRLGQTFFSTTYMTWRLALPAIAVPWLIGFLLFPLHNSSLIFSYSVIMNKIIQPAVQFLVECISAMTLYSIIGAMYYDEVYGGNWMAPEQAKKRFRSRAFVPSCLVGFMAFCIGALMLFYIVPDTMRDTLMANHTEVTAHRGVTDNAPENSLRAFEDAITMGIVDYVELDVQMTRDGVVVVSHDPTLKRTTGQNVRICDLTYEELQNIPLLGKDQNGNEVTASIPSLKQVMMICRDKIKMNIEIKGCEESPLLEKATANIIKDFGYINNCVVTSLDYESLVKIKEAAPQIRTGYILAMAIGDYYTMPDVDFFSVESTFISRKMVENLHAFGKEVHAWTISTEDDAAKMLECRVDNLITNDPVTISAAIVKAGNVPLRLYDLYRKYWDPVEEDDGQPLSIDEA